tara:strand:+ start:195 stop:3038 length:2844 start_codon:yes stop_codon:yes gene_type:complete
MAIDKFGKGGFDSADSSFQGLGSLSSISTFTIFGCTDSTAFNFNPSVNTDDGSCIPIALGCIDTLAVNFDASANTDTTPTSCQYPGCTDPLAFNYDANANFDDGSCIPVVGGCIDNSQDNNIYTFPDYSVDLTGATNFTLNNTAPTLGLNNYSFSLNINYNVPVGANTDDGSCIQRIYGCMDPTSFNYNDLANTEPIGICHYPIFGCTTVASCNYDPNADNDDGSCTFCNINANNVDNYDSLATCDTHCLFCEPSEIDMSLTTTSASSPTAASINLNWTQPSFSNSANTVSYTIRYKIDGTSGWTSVTGVTGFNYNIQNLLENTTYKVQIRSICANSNTNFGQTSQNFTTPAAVVLGCTTGSITYPQVNSNFNPIANSDDGSCVPCIYGCTDNTQFNYDALATCNDGSCVAVLSGCMDSTASNFNASANTPGQCEYEGCTDPTAFNYSFVGSNVTNDGDAHLSGIAVDDGSCVAVLNGCTNTAAFNYDPAANTDDGSCVAVVLGCIDATAINFDSSANTDDGSCIAAVSGCTDSNALNYDASANVENNTCAFSGCADPFAIDYAFDLTASVPVNANQNALGIHPTFPTNLIYQYPLANSTITTANVTSVQSDCNFPDVPGCTDATANNYSSLATIDDGSCCFGSSASGSSGTLADGTPCAIGCTSPGFTNSSMSSLVNVQGNTVAPNVSVFNNASPYWPDPSDGGCLNWTTNPTMNQVVNEASDLANQNLSFINSTGGTFSDNQIRHGVGINLTCGVVGDSSGCPDMSAFTGPFGTISIMTAVADSLTTGVRVYEDNTTSGQQQNISDFWQGANSLNEYSFVSSGGIGVGVGANTTSNYDLIEPAHKIAIQGLVTGSTGFAAVPTTGINSIYPFLNNTVQVTYKTIYGAIVHVDTYDIKVGCTDYRANNYCPTCNADIPTTNSVVSSSTTSSTGLETTSGFNLCDYS